MLSYPDYGSHTTSARLAVLLEKSTTASVLSKPLNCVMKEIKGDTRCISYNYDRYAYREERRRGTRKRKDAETSSVFAQTDGREGCKSRQTAQSLLAPNGNITYREREERPQRALILQPLPGIRRQRPSRLDACTPRRTSRACTPTKWRLLSRGTCQLENNNQLWGFQTSLKTRGATYTLIRVVPSMPYRVRLPTISVG